MIRAVGVDFGTTNSVVAILEEDGHVTTRRYGSLDVFRSVLCLWVENTPARRILRDAAGAEAVDAYLEDPLDTRLIMSMKTYLAQRSFTETRIFGHPFTLERLIGRFLSRLLAGLPPAASVVVGRPVRFAGEFIDDALGDDRLRGAYAEAGIPHVIPALEPEAAGVRFAGTLEQAATVLIGDFGGGTSDFSVMHFDPQGGATALGHAGIGIAGDMFDYRIIDRAIAPLLGKGDTYRVMGKPLPVPPEYYSGFARWHLLSLMRTPRTLRAIAEVARTAQRPERLLHLIALIEDGVGYELYQTVAGVKAELSCAEAATLRFRHKDFAVERVIARDEFEDWIAADLARLDATLDQVLALANVTADGIDRIFLTGGTAFVPAVRRLFERRFGTGKLAGGGEFVSVAEGLALLGQQARSR
jgi:hypothetical chaperone protein